MVQSGSPKLVHTLHALHYVISLNCTFILQLMKCVAKIQSFGKTLRSYAYLRILILNPMKVFLEAN